MWLFFSTMIQFVRYTGILTRDFDSDIIMLSPQCYCNLFSRSSSSKPLNIPPTNTADIGKNVTEEEEQEEKYVRNRKIKRGEWYIVNVKPWSNPDTAVYRTSIHNIWVYGSWRKLCGYTLSYDYICSWYAVYLFVTSLIECVLHLSLFPCSLSQSRLVFGVLTHLFVHFLSLLTHCHLHLC